MRRERVVRRANRLRDGAGGKALALCSYEKPEDFKPRRLAQRRQRG